MNPTFIIPITPMQPTGSVSETKRITPETETGEPSFLDTLKTKIQGVKDLETASLESAYDVAMGYSDDIESAMIDATKASAAIEMTTQLTTRAVNAYKEIMEMQI